jgi:inhibitor of cysteine peptidase
MLHIDMSVDGRVIEMRRREIVELSLAESPTTGFRWNLRTTGEPILALVEDSFEPGGARPGQGGVHRWRFQALEIGVAALELAYRRKWEPPEQIAKTFRIQIRVVD